MRLQEQLRLACDGLVTLTGSKLGCTVVSSSVFSVRVVRFSTLQIGVSLLLCSISH